MVENIISNEKLDGAIAYVLKKLDESMPEFTYKFPAAQSEGYIYPAIDNICWTGSFYTGMLWLAYELTGNEKYKKTAEVHVESFYERIEKQIEVEHHDLGFLYSLSCVSAYKITGNKKAKKAALMAADKLITRFKEKGEFIQAWGAADDPTAYRLIIDCLLNIPLLFWAAEETNDNKYLRVAKMHLRTACKYTIRDDFTTFHTYYFNPETGAPERGVTRQGFSDSSCWARGQAWGIDGLAVAYAYTKDEELLPMFEGVTKVFLEKLPADYVPYWDMIFTQGDEPRDTSSAAIAVCGILEMEKYIHNQRFIDYAGKMLNSLIDNYTTKNLAYSNGILTDGMYSRPDGHNPECNIWGDYFYFEALMRLKKPEWKMYW